MKKTVFVFVLLVFFLVVSVFGLFSFYSGFFEKVDLAGGRENFMKYCVVCHGEKGHGDGVRSADLLVSPDNIYSEITNVLGFKGELINSVLEGDNGEGGSMPAFKDDLTAQDVNDILEYVRSVNEVN